MIASRCASEFRLEAALLGILLSVTPGISEDFTELCADRAAIERVYYSHRLGEKPSFENALPRATLDRLVRDDLHKKALLKKVYSVEITPEMVEAEVKRINSTTRAPDVLAELKAALGNDSARFAKSVALPILVERCLHDRFDNDERLHAPQRRAAETARNELVAAKKSGAGLDELVLILTRCCSTHVAEVIWQLGPRTEGKAASQNPDEAELRTRFGPNAQILSTQLYEKGRKFYFDDLPRDLQEVLRVQLRQPCNVSAVIEARDSFRVYLAKERTAESLSAMVLTLPKLDYEKWVADQNTEGN